MNAAPNRRSAGRSRPSGNSSRKRSPTCAPARATSAGSRRSLPGRSRPDSGSRRYAGPSAAAKPGAPSPPASARLAPTAHPDAIRESPAPALDERRAHATMERGSSSRAESMGKTVAGPRFRPGQRILVTRSGHSADADSLAEILQVIATETAEIYRVRWHHGHETYLVPGPRSARPAAARRRAAARDRRAPTRLTRTRTRGGRAV